MPSETPKFNEVQSIRDVLRPGDSAVVLMTRGAVLKLNEDGTGSTGNWRASPGPHVNRVILYVKMGRTRSPAQLWRADYTGATNASEPGRVVIHFRNAELVAATRALWTEFAGGGQSAIRYVDA